MAAPSGLIAKPTIDILMVMKLQIDSQEIIKLLIPFGWIVFQNNPPPEFHIDCDLGYTPHGFAEKVFHLHIRREGDWDEPYFAWYLRTHQEIFYECTKLNEILAKKFRHNRDGYTETKGEFIKKITQLARLEDKNRLI